MKYRTRAEINLDSLAYNAGLIREKVAPARVVPVVKADAYGHGAVPVVRRLVKEGFGMFAVAQFQEAMELRESGIVQPILILSRLFPDEIPEAVRAGFRICVYGEEDLQRLEAARLPVPATIHVKVETGMGRTGVILQNEPAFFDRLIQARSCTWEGLFTHFATADERDKTYANLQIFRFREVLARVRKAPGGGPRMVHMASSAGILDLPESYFDAVRPGILLYGHYPSGETSRCMEPRQVMTLKTYVAHVREMPEGHSVSYGRRWTAPRRTKVAVLPVGYADGISRKFTNTGEVLIRGKRYPMVGTVAMDYTMVNVGDDPVAVEDEVLLWGESPQGVIHAAEVAEKIGTIPYELTCGVSKRVRRVYTGGE